jgi:hypothetical protein
MTDLDLGSATKEGIIGASPFPVEFANVNLIHADLEIKIKSKLESPMAYKRMCAFLFYFFFQLSFLPDHTMRMDTNSCILSDMPSNPFQVMHELSLDYMYHSTLKSPVTLLEKLRDFVSQHPGVPGRCQCKCIFDDSLFFKYYQRPQSTFLFKNYVDEKISLRGRPQCVKQAHVQRPFSTCAVP